MYTYRPVTERMQRMRERIRDRVVVNSRTSKLSSLKPKNMKSDPMIKRPLTPKSFVKNDRLRRR